MPSLTRRALVTLAALGPAAALAAPGASATGSGPPPPPEAEALLERATYRGDPDVMLGKGAGRVLTAYSKTDFFVDKGESGGVTYEYMRAFEAFLQERQGGKGAKAVVSFVPVSRDRLIPALLAGEGDLAAANLTVTPERRARVDFSEPYLEGVREGVVTGPASPDLAAVDGPAGGRGGGRLPRALPGGRQGGGGARPGLARPRRRRRPRRPGGVGAAVEQLLGEPPGPRPAPRRREARAPAAGRGRRAPRGRG